MARPARVSPDRILAAAAAEFAARGYAGARVDRIARRARVNKAMLYYHFHNKADLYHALLRQIFGRAADRLAAIGASDAPAPEQVDRVIAGIAEFVQEHAFFPAIMLREIAEGGRRLDRDTLAALSALPRAVAGIIRRGIDRGDFRQVNPLAAYFAMFAPIVFYLAGAPIRQQLSRRRLVDLAEVPPDAFVRHLQEATRRALARSVSAIR
jgi:TetR/AcrR family transcriptional regulator